MGTLYVRNSAQAVLWEELDGQISDGKWENARPMDHWKVWCDAEVAIDDKRVGRNFYARKDNYNFTDKQLLDIVGARMIEAVREKTGAVNYTWTQLRADLTDLKQIVRTFDNGVNAVYVNGDLDVAETERRYPAFRATMEKLRAEDRIARQAQLDGVFGGLEVLHETR